MIRKAAYTLFVIFFPIILFSQNTDLIEVTGHVKYKGEEEPIPGIVVEVVGEEKGVVTNYDGNFTLVINKGQKLKFSATGFKDAYYNVPVSTNSKYHTMDLEMSVDTVYLNEVLISNLMNPEQFNYAFKYGYTPDEQLMNIRRNTGASTQAILINTLARSGAESQQLQQINYSMKYGSNLGMNPFSSGGLGSARAWKSFVEAWKNGDFRGKKK